uniref:Uncharacterized protein n=1 Tax=Rhizophora mucronata TaxID=61149 RepID=A0A2P2QKE9_RHIMU
MNVKAGILTGKKVLILTIGMRGRGPKRRRRTKKNTRTGTRIEPGVGTVTERE